MAIDEGLRSRMAERKTKSSRPRPPCAARATCSTGELAVALGMDIEAVEPYIASRIGGK